MWSLLIVAWATYFAANRPTSNSSASAAPALDAGLMEKMTQQVNASSAEHLPAARAMFETWCKAAPTNRSLRLFRDRLVVLNSLRDEVSKQLRSAGEDAVGKMVQHLWEDGEKPQSPPETAVPVPIVTAEQFYRLYLPHFRSAIDTAELRPAEKEFARAYYNAEIQAAIGEIMRLGRPLATAGGSRSAELEFYLLLLPLLHNPSRFAIESLAELPGWMWASENLARLADFCLFRVGRLDAAEAILLRLRRQDPTAENRYELYLYAAERCAAAHVPGMAVQCLEAAQRLLDAGDDRRLKLRLRVCDVWAEAQNWAMAAGEAGQIAHDYPDSPPGGNALVRRIRYLAAQKDDQTILHEIDEVIKDERCAPCLPELTYVKWKSLRQQGQGLAASLVLKKFLEAYPQDPRGAEMFFTVALDCLVAQRRDEGLAVLQSLETRYPGSAYHRRAADLIEQLRGRGTATSGPSDTLEPASTTEIHLRRTQRDAAP